jgi:hypothetical protein
MDNEFATSDAMARLETGTLIFWDPVIRRALTEQSALQWICSSKPVFGRIFDISLIAKVSEGWYLSDSAQTPRAFAYPTHIRFALDPELYLDGAVEAISPLRRQQGGVWPSFRKKMHFIQRLEIPRNKLCVSGLLVYEVFKNEVKQPTAYTPFSIPLKD